MNCIMQAFEMFKTKTCQASTIAAAAFVLGMVVSCLVCRLVRSGGSCGCGRGGKGARREADGTEDTGGPVLSCGAQERRGARGPLGAYELRGDGRRT